MIFPDVSKASVDRKDGKSNNLSKCYLLIGNFLNYVAVRLQLIDNLSSTGIVRGGVKQIPGLRPIVFMR